MGYHAHVAVGDGGFEAVQATEWDEPQAVIATFINMRILGGTKSIFRGEELETAHHHDAEGGPINSIQLRGEYLYTTLEKAARVYDVANVANKGFSERMSNRPFHPLTRHSCLFENATSFALPTTMPVAPYRTQLPGSRNTTSRCFYQLRFYH